MRIGDLVRIARCGIDCYCWFCINNSNRIGLVIDVNDDAGHLLFDVGERHVFPYEVEKGIVEVISESR